MLISNALIFFDYGGAMRVTSVGTITCNALQIYIIQCAARQFASKMYVV